MRGNPLELVRSGSDVDFELAEVLGEKAVDLLVLYFCGEKFRPFGTPFDGPEQREVWSQMIAEMNEGSSEWWLEFCRSWEKELASQYGKDFPISNPRASMKVHRVVAGYSSSLSMAMKLLERLGPSLAAFEIAKVGANYAVTLEAKKVQDVIRVERVDGALAVAVAVRNLLRVAEFEILPRGGAK